MLESEITRQRVLKTIVGRAFRSGVVFSTADRVVENQVENRDENQVENQVENRMENQVENRMENQDENRMEKQIVEEESQVDIQETLDDSEMLTETSEEEEYEYDIF